MTEQSQQEEITGAATAADPAVTTKKKRSVSWGFIIGVVGVVLTVAMTVGIVFYQDKLESLKHFGYLGAFFISILGGATVVIPVPMLAVVFALGSTMDTVWQVALLGLAAAAGELIGAYTIYMTGKGAGQAMSSARSGRIQRTYEKMLGLMERRGPLTLFIVASVVNPFFYPAAMAAGALRLGLWKYTGIVLTGKIIKCMTVVYLGYYGLGSILRAIGLNV